MDMGGMNMDGMDMGAMSTGSGELDMDMDGDGVMDMSSADMNGGGMNMGEGETMNMAETGEKVLDMDMDGDGVMDMSSDDMNSGGMNMAEGETMNMAEGGDGQMEMGDTMDMAEGEEADEEEAERMMAGQMAGLMISEDGEFDREIKLSMVEWGFSDLEIDAKPGERIKFTLRNDGTVLHEFMFMTMAAMQAVNYRAKRADWNLLEHEALFEQSLLLPGEEITFVATVTKPGAWMFMCMLPYHMQMGMMGQMATEGMAMSMEM